MICFKYDPQTPEWGALRHILYSRINKIYPLIALLSPHSGVWGSKSKKNKTYH